MCEKAMCGNKKSLNQKNNGHTSYIYEAYHEIYIVIFISKMFHQLLKPLLFYTNLKRNCTVVHLCI